ncbi:hypothetical protein [Pararhizobium antarcticum]|nr:hypothetical protein [Pararhizobium antarcticum]
MMQISAIARDGTILGTRCFNGAMQLAEDQTGLAMLRQWVRTKFHSRIA